MIIYSHLSLITFFGNQNWTRARLVQTLFKFWFLHHRFYSLKTLQVPTGKKKKVYWSDLALKNPTTGEIPLMTHTANNIKPWKDCVAVPLHYTELSLFPWFYICGWFSTPGTNSQIVSTEVIHAWLLVKFSTNTIFTRFQDVFMSQNQTRLIFRNDLKRV